MPHAALCVSGLRGHLLTQKFTPFQCRTQHYVCRDYSDDQELSESVCFNAARSIVCVGTGKLRVGLANNESFQCRTQHYVCRDQRVSLKLQTLFRFNAARSIMCVGTGEAPQQSPQGNVSMPHAALCVSGLGSSVLDSLIMSRFNAARSIVCVGTGKLRVGLANNESFQCRTQHYVCRDQRVSLKLQTLFRFNAARSIMCVGTFDDIKASFLRKFQCRTQHCVCRDFQDRGVHP